MRIIYVVFITYNFFMESKRAIRQYMSREWNTPEPVMRFLSLFNQIDKYFDKVLGLNVFIPYNEKIKRISEWDYFISRFVKLHQFQLKYIGEIRNQITHGIKMDWHTYIQPTEYAIQYLEKYVHDIKKPPRCADIFKKDVFTCKYDDKLIDIVHTMQNHNYSHIPVYNRDNKFVWLLNESNILQWLSENKNNNLNLAKVWDIKLINDRNYVQFISRMVNVYEVDKLFANKKDNWLQIWILLITENGRSDEPLIGIISAWDTAIIDSHVVH